MPEIISQIKWSREDIINVLTDNDVEPNEENINKFIESFDWRFFEEKLIQYGFEMLAGSVGR